MPVNRYLEEGYESRKDYLKSLSEDYGVSYKTASILGPDEDFDALVVELEDLEGEAYD